MLGFEGPYSGTRQQILIRANHRFTIPSNAEYSVPQLRLLLREVETILSREVTQDEWAALS